jgi:hypothetical protein
MTFKFFASHDNWTLLSQRAHTRGILHSTKGLPVLIYLRDGLSAWSWVCKQALVLSHPGRSSFYRSNATKQMRFISHIHDIKLLPQCIKSPNYFPVNSTLLYGVTTIRFFSVRQVLTSKPLARTRRSAVLFVTTLLANKNFNDNTIVRLFTGLST